jgi:hypothetical protein
MVGQQRDGDESNNDPDGDFNESAQRWSAPEPNAELER